MKSFTLDYSQGCKSITAQMSENAVSPTKACCELCLSKGNCSNKKNIPTSKDVQITQQLKTPASTIITCVLFQGELQLSTTAKSLFKPTDKFEVTEDYSTRLNLIKSVGTVACCSLKTMSKCLNCNKAIDTETNSGIVRCHHCLAKQKLTQTHITRTLSIQLDSLKMVKKFVIFNDILNSFLAKYNLQNLNNDEIENYILSVGEIILSHNIGSDIVVQFDVTKVEDE